MQLRIFLCILIILLISLSNVSAQITTFPYSENFDNVTVPNLPIGWSASGFVDSTSVPHSSPNCIMTKGNATTKMLTSPVFDFTNRVPDKLTFCEYRSGTAKYYRLEVRAATDGVNFNILLVRYDSISTTTSYVQRVINLLGTGLQQQSNVKFRLQLLGDNTNITGVLRIDDVSLTIVTGFDVGLNKMTISPANATRKDSLVLSTMVKNYGAFSAANFSVQFYYDDNCNGVAELKEQFAVIDGLSLNSNDSLICTTTHSSMKIGKHHFIAVIDFPQDENRSNDTTSIIVNVGCANGDLLVNEIMYAPIGDEPEWVEFFNASQTASI